MSKSFKKNPVQKIRGRQKEDYWSKVRSKTKTVLRSKHYTEIDEELLPHEKEIVNDYDYIEQIGRNEDDPKYKRK